MLLNGLTEPELRSLQEAHGGADAMHPVNVHWALLREGEYDLTAQLCAELERCITNMMQRVNGDPNVRVHIQYDAPRRRITVCTNRRFALYCPERQSLLHLLGMGVDTQKFQSETGEHMECIVFSDKHSARNPVSLCIISLRFVYSDIVSQGIVGGSYTNQLGYLPEQCKFGDQAYPPYYVRLASDHIRTIRIQLARDTGDEFPLSAGGCNVVCQLNFRRVKNPY